jgi:hypothetical protein
VKAVKFSKPNVYAFVAFLPQRMIHVPHISEVMDLTTPAMSGEEYDL